MTFATAFDLETLKVLVRMEEYDLLRLSKFFDLRELYHLINSWDRGNYIVSALDPVRDEGGVVVESDGHFSFISGDRASYNELQTMVVRKYLIPFTEKLRAAFSDMPDNLLSSDVYNILKLCDKINEIRNVEKDDYYKWENGKALYFRNDRKD